MQKKLHIQTKDTQKLSSVLSNTPVQGMFESRSFIVQPKQQGDSQKPNLKTSLMQAERYGHHLHEISSQKLPIQQKTLVIGGPAKPTNLGDIANSHHASYDQYIGNAYKYVGGQDQADNTQNPPLRIPDKFGAREAKGWKNLPKRILGRFRGTEKHGPRKSYQPQGNEETQYLRDLGQNQTLNITAHGTKSGKIGGYKPKKLAKLLVNSGLQPGQEGTLNLRACRGASAGKKQTQSPALQLENELRKRRINMNVMGFRDNIQANQMYEQVHSNPNAANAIRPARLVGTEPEKARLENRPPVLPPIGNLGRSLSDEVNQEIQRN